MAITGLTVTLDAEEYSRFESDLNTVNVTIAITGTPASNEVVTVELRKARRNRDVIIFAFTAPVVTATLPYYATCSIPLQLLMDVTGCPLVRRGMYFLKAYSVLSPGPEGTSPDFRVSLVTAHRLFHDYLHGVDAKSIDLLMVRQQPQRITGVTVTDVSRGHAQTFYPMTYTGKVGAEILDGTAATGSTASIINWTGGGLVVNAHAGKYLLQGADAVLIASNTASAITVSTPLSVAPIAGAELHINDANAAHALQWCNGPRVTIQTGVRTYLLRRSANDSHFLEVKVNSALLPTKGVTEELLIDRRPLDSYAMQGIVDRAASWAEDEELAIFLEPTRVITDIPAANTLTITGLTGGSVTAFPLGDWDAIRPSLSYYPPSNWNHIEIKFPYYPVQRFISLQGKLGTQLALDVPQEWITIAPGGFVQLVAYSMSALGTYAGVLIFQATYATRTVPGFWHYDAIVGFKETPEVLIELVAKKAALDILDIAAQASYNAISQKTINHDGVVETVSYTTSAMYGIYSASTISLRKWIDENLRRLRGAFRGPNVMVL